MAVLLVSVLLVFISRVALCFVSNNEKAIINIVGKVTINRNSPLVIPGKKDHISTNAGLTTMETMGVNEEIRSMLKMVFFFI